MSAPIKAGDLVMVVRSHCAAQEAGIGGRIYVAEGYGDSTPIACWHCHGDYGEGMPQIAMTSSKGTKCFHPAAWLKRIEPLSTPEHVENREELTA